MSDSKKIKRARLITQIINAVITNGFFQGFINRTIFKGQTKKMCVPGMNCYSCPGALGSCPIGALQAVLGSAKYHASLYVGGIIAAFGIIFGRFICGWLCVFGWIQDLLYKIPVPKLTVPEKLDRVLRYLKYVILIVFVVALPLFAVDAQGQAPPYFCQWICPVGTLEGGIPLVLGEESLRATIGFLFYFKFVILAVIVVLSMFVYRPFCKYICPLGAIYGLFNKISIVRLRRDVTACTNCGMCKAACNMQVDPVKTCDSTECIKCGKCVGVCPTKALHLGVK